jgi:type II secretory pathway pseudopilin PulG
MKTSRSTAGLSPRRDRNRRAGFTIIESAVASILLAAVFLTAIPTLGWIVRARRATERQQAAVIAVGNLMERFTASEWENLTPEKAAQLSLPESVMRQLPDAELKVTVADATDDSAGRKISIELRWPESTHGSWSAPVRLTAWVYPPARSER